MYKVEFKQKEIKMSSELKQYGAACLSAALCLYESANGAPGKAFAVPVSGFVISHLGEYMESESVRKVGEAILTASACVFPIGVVGHNVHAFGLKSFVGKVMPALACATLAVRIVNGVIVWARNRGAVDPG
jgi:hypothetical protein